MAEQPGARPPDTVAGTWTRAKEKPRVAKGGPQLRAVLRKNCLLKRRSWFSTCCELFSPALFVAILVFGYSLSDTEVINAGIYAVVDLDLAPLLAVAAPLLVNWNPISLLNVSVASDAPPSPPALPCSALDGCEDFDLRSLGDQVLKVFEGPLPIIPFDVYVAAGSSIRALVDDEAYDQIAFFDEYVSVFGNLLNLGTLHFSPDTEEVRDFVNFAKRKHPFLNNVTTRIHATENKAVDYVLDTTDSELTWAVVAFDKLSPTQCDFSIRLNYSTVPNTNRITNFIARGLDTSYQKYTTSGFFTLQNLVDEYAFTLANEANIDHPNRTVVAPPTSYAFATPMPTAKFNSNIFYRAVSYLLSLVLTMSLLYPVSMLTKAIVEEKELRLKQTMRIMGLRDSQLYLSWWLSALLQFIIISFVCALVAKLFMVSTPIYVIYIYLQIFTVGCISFAFLLSVFFSNGVLSAVVAPIAFFAALLPRFLFFGSNRYEQTQEKILCSLLLPSAFAFGADILADYELAEIGVTPANWFDDDYSFALSLFMMGFDAVLYLLLALYLERVLPSRYGSREHPLFFLLPRYWCPSRYAPPRSTRAPMQAGPAFEPLPDELLHRDSLEIVHLTKTYGSGKLKKTAVDDLSLSFCSGQITCLLGHNGAGKTSTLSVMTGLYPPTSGDCFIFGHSITFAKKLVYRILGICPQHDVLWRSLTVSEHLRLYATLKGVPKSKIPAAVTEMMQQVGIPEKAHALSRTLSGGMKRKLSVGCALIGGSRAVLLDEPSSGMDPASRRGLWDLLQTCKKDRVLILTTHYMDEADLLADRIAVLSTGKLRCCGSSFFLKSRFGLGYTLTMSKRDDACSQLVVTRALRGFVGEAELLSEHGGELAYRLPFNRSQAFGKMLRYLDANADELHICGYGMSVSSMEEVFLRLAQGEEAVVSHAVDGERAGSPPHADVQTPGPPTNAARAGQTSLFGTPYAVTEVEHSPVRMIPVDSELLSSSPPALAAAAQDDCLRLSPAVAQLDSLEPPRDVVELDVEPPTVGTLSASSSAGSSSGSTAVRAAGSCHGGSAAVMPAEALVVAAAVEVDAPIEPNDVQIDCMPFGLLHPTGSKDRVTPHTQESKSATPRVMFNESRKPSAPRAKPISLSRQLLVLLRKRFTCIRRDRKAIVSQQLLPVALVALTLLILTIQDPRVGPAIRMDAALYRKQSRWESEKPSPTEFLVNARNETPLIRDLDHADLEIVPIDAANASSDGRRPEGLFSLDSLGLSDYLLETYNEHPGKERMGGAVLDDRVHVVVDADGAEGQAPELARLLPGGLLSGLANGGLFLGVAATCFADDVGPLLVPLRAAAAELNSALATAAAPSPPSPAVSGVTLTAFESLLNELIVSQAGSGEGTASLTEAVVSFAASSLATAAAGTPAENLGLSLLLDEAALLGTSEGLQANGAATALCAPIRAAILDGDGADAGGEGASGTPGAPTTAEARLLRGEPLAGSGWMLGGRPLRQVALELAAAEGARTALAVSDAIFPLELSELVNSGGYTTLYATLESLAIPLISQRVVEDPSNPQNILQLSLLQILVQLLGAFSQVEQGGTVRLTRLEGAWFELDDLLASDAAGLLPSSVRNGTSLRAFGVQGEHLAMRLGSVTISRNEIVVGDIQLRGDLGPVASARAALRNSSFEVDTFVLRKKQIYIGNSSYSYGAETGSFASITIDEDLVSLSELPSNFNISFPVGLSVLHNSSSPHAAAAFVGEFSEAAWLEAQRGGVSAQLWEEGRAGGTSTKEGRRLSEEEEVEAEAYYAVYNKPLPLTARQSLEVKLLLAVLSSLFLLIPFCYIPASAAVFVVRERSSKSKHLQLVSGVNAQMYWLSTYVWDMLCYSLICVLTLCVMLCYGEPAFVADAAQSFATFCVFFLYGFAVIPQVYCYSFLFDSPTTAQISIIIFNLVAAFGLVIAHQIMSVLENTQQIDRALVHLWRVLPGYNFGEAVLGLSTTYYSNQLINFDEPASPFAWEVTGRSLLLMFFEAFLFAGLLLCIEHSTFVLSRLQPLLDCLCFPYDASPSLSWATRRFLPLSLVFSLILIAIGAGVGLSALVGGGLLLMLVALLFFLFYERRLRRRGGTMAGLALEDLTRLELGANYVEEEDVAEERARVAAYLGGAALSASSERLITPAGSRSTTPRGDARRPPGAQQRPPTASSSSSSGSSSGGGGAGGRPVSPAAAAADQPAVLLSQISKVFPPRGKSKPKVAVVDLSLSIPTAECFGFLGVNGAGKTTTLSILTGDIQPTSGSAWIDGCDVVREQDRVRERMGYCPQTDPLLELMTARETLTMFARLKNLNEKLIPGIVSTLIEKVTLTPYADRVAGSYSGGNKRKLSLAIALVGSPAVIFLDEPSSGMDPLSRRHMWDIITAERAQRSVVLTTHSMEECEALCTRIGIMTAGRFQCLGGQQRLKNKFGGGYTLEFKAASRPKLVGDVKKLFPGAEFESHHAGKYKFKLSHTSTSRCSLAEIFEIVEEHKARLGITDYSASQPSLESIFLAIAESDLNRTADHPATAPASAAPAASCDPTLASSSSDFSERVSSVEMASH